MKLLDVVRQIAKRLPLFTDEVTDTIEVTSIVHTGTTALITTPKAHGLLPDNSVHVIGAKTGIPIASITHAVDTTIAVITTDADHDLIFYDDTTLDLAVLSGSVEAEFNGEFAVLDVINRRVFQIAVVLSAPTSGTGTPVLENGSSFLRTVQGQYPVATVPSPTTLTVEHTNASDLGTLIGTIELRARPRVSAGVDEESIFKSFTQAAEDEESGDRQTKTWVYAMLDDASVSRGRDSRLDSIDVQSRGADWQQYLNNPLKILVAIKASDQTLGENARDTAQDLLRPILRSLLGKAFDSGLSTGACAQVQFVGHGLARYDSATYWHEFNFEERALIKFDDTIGADDDVAFRDWDLTFDPDVDKLDGEGVVTDVFSLDDVPL